MRPTFKTAFALSLALLGGTRAGAELTFNWVNRDTGVFTPQEQVVIDTALTIWKNRVPTPEPREIFLDIIRDDLPGLVGLTTDHVEDALGNPLAAAIAIDSNSPFFVDPSPFDNSEFAPSGHPFHFNAVAPEAVGKWDLLSVVLHEVGHAMGVADSYDRFYSRLDKSNCDFGCGYFGEDAVVSLADGEHLADGYDLMGVPAVGGGISQRALPSTIDLKILNDTFEYGNKNIYRYGGLQVPLNDLATTNISLPIGQGTLIKDLDVALLIQHTYASDLRINLISPQGTRVLLIPETEFEGENLGDTSLWTRFDDEAALYDAADYAPPLEGTYHPDGRLSDFDDESTAGTWTLEVVDTFEDDVGKLLDFVLIAQSDPTAEADFNGDGQVDGSDLAVWGASFGENQAADADADGDSDGSDFLIWQREFGIRSIAPTVGMLPEPRAITMVLCVLVAMSIIGRSGNPPVSSAPWLR